MPLYRFASQTLLRSKPASETSAFTRAEGRVIEVFSARGNGSKGTHHFPARVFRPGPHGDGARRGKGTNPSNSRTGELPRVEHLRDRGDHLRYVRKCGD